jgi:hypothetical protein
MKMHPVEFTVDELSTLQIAVVVASQEFLKILTNSNLPINKSDRDRYDRIMAIQQKISLIFAEAIADNEEI